jgi:putative endonuclease
MAYREYYVYILASESGTLYVGMTRDLVFRVSGHKAGTGSKFTARYKVTKLVYYEVTYGPLEAIAREKQIKGYRREKKVKLIESMNPGWRDLADPS